MPASVLRNFRLIAILAASLLAGYAGDEVFNAWWAGAGQSSSAQSLASTQAAPAELARADALPPS